MENQEINVNFMRMFYLYKNVDKKYNKDNLSEFFDEISETKKLLQMGMWVYFLMTKEENSDLMEDVILFDTREQYPSKSFVGFRDEFYNSSGNGSYIFFTDSHNFSIIAEDGIVFNMDNRFPEEFLFRDLNIQNIPNDNFEIYNFYNIMQYDSNNCGIFAVQNTLQIREHLKSSGKSLRDIVENSKQIQCEVSRSYYNTADRTCYETNSIAIPLCLVDNVQNLSHINYLQKKYKELKNEKYKNIVIKEAVEEEIKEKNKPTDKKEVEIIAQNKPVVNSDKNNPRNTKINKIASNVARKIYDFYITYFSCFEESDIDFYLYYKKEGVDLIKNIFKMRAEGESQDNIIKFIKEKNKKNREKNSTIFNVSVFKDIGVDAYDLFLNYDLDNFCEISPEENSDHSNKKPTLISNTQNPTEKEKQERGK